MSVKHEKCQIQTCQQNCCNLYGYCPIKSTDPQIQNCYYHYSASSFSITNNPGPFVAIILGSVGLFILLVLLIRKLWAYCQKKYFIYTPNAEKAQNKDGVSEIKIQFRQGEAKQKISRYNQIPSIGTKLENQDRIQFPRINPVQAQQFAVMKMPPTPNIGDDQNQITMQNILQNPPEFYFIE